MVRGFDIENGDDCGEGAVGLFEEGFGELVSMLGVDELTSLKEILDYATGHYLDRDTLAHGIATTMAMYCEGEIEERKP